MKIYCIQYMYENGDEFWRYFRDEYERDKIYEIDKNGGMPRDLCIRKRDYVEIEK